MATDIILPAPLADTPAIRRADAAPCRAAALDYVRRGVPITLCREKQPIHKGWQNRRFTEAQVNAAFDRNPALNIGIVLGPASSIVDVEADSPEQAAVYQRLFAGVTKTPSYKSPRGTHWLFGYPADFAGLDSAVVYIEELGIRIGAGGGAQSVFPPSAGREWIVPLDECDLADLPAIVIQRVRDAATKPKPAAAPGVKKLDKAIEKLITVCEEPADGDRSKADFALLTFAIRNGYDLELLWDRVAGIGKFGVRGRDYFDLTARKAAEVVAGDPSGKKKNGRKLDPATEAKSFLLSREKRLCFYRGGWWESKGSRYEPIADTDVRGAIIRHLDESYFALTGGTIGNVVDHARAHAEIKSSLDMPAWLSGGKWPASEVLPMQTRLLHLPTLTTIPATPEFFTPTALDFDFDPSAPQPDRWLEFLGQLWPIDPDCIDLLQEYFGLLLTLDTRQQKILMLIGPRRSGKGTIARILHRLIGLANVAGPTVASLASNFGLAGLLGKSLAIISDARLSGRSDQAVVIERLLRISGEDCLDIDRKFQHPICCRLPTRLMVLSNELPRLADASGALASRFLVLPLRESFYGREDRTLTDRLLAELPGILNWSIAGWRRLQDRGHFVQPTAGQELIDQLYDLASPISTFIRQRCIVDPGQQVAIQELFRAWQEWCHTAGMNATTSNIFSRDLSAAMPGLSRRRPRDGDGRGTVVQGLGLRTGTGGTCSDGDKVSCKEAV